MKSFIDLLKYKILKTGYTSNKHELYRHYIKLFISGIISSIGLGLNSSPLVVGGLLISPLFNPISHIILYFFTIKNKSFILKYILYLTLDVFILFSLGYLGGFFFDRLKRKYKVDKNSKETAEHLPEDLITDQMFYRTGIVPIIANCIVCFLGGVLMLNTFLKDDISYSIGISICISFIIPIVNSGMLTYHSQYYSAIQSFLIFISGLFVFMFSIIFFSFTYL